jgi:hypothetical protein
MHYVMIGNSIASTACIEAIRSIDRKGSITVIGEEDHPCTAGPSSPTCCREKPMRTA